MFPQISKWFGSLKPLHLYFLIFVSGGFSVLSLAPFFYWPFFAIGVFILISSLDCAKQQGLGKRSLFWRAFTFGFGYFAFSMFWVGAAFLVDAKKFAWLMPIAITLLPAFLSIYWGIGGLLYGIFAKNNALRAFLFAASFAFLEFLRGHLFTGLPWNLPAYIWKAGGYISQSGALIGPYGVSLLTLFVFAALSIALVEKTRHTRTAATIALIIAFGGIGFGFQRLIGANATLAPSGSPIIAVGQSGFSQKDLWLDGNQAKVAQTYFDLMDTDAAKSAHLIVFPEGALPFLPFEEPLFLYELNRKLGSRVLAFGAIRSEPNGGNNYRYFNSIAFVKAGNDLPQVLGIYDKYHLVPFGEYLPFKPIFNVLGVTSLVAVGDDFSKPAGPKTLLIDKLPRIDARVCYEIIFPSFQPKYNQRADFILNVSVDAWYGDLLGPDQHYNQARWRAIESGQPLVRSASGGWSAITDSFGRPIAELRIGNRIIAATLPARIAAPFFYNHGEVAFLIISLIFSFLGIVLATKLKV